MIVDYNTKTGDRIRFMRISRNLTQDELAANLGISSRRVSDYEKGIKVPDSKIIDALSAFFKCEPSYFTSDGCLREEAGCDLNNFIYDICEGSANDKGEFESTCYIMADKNLYMGRKTFVWRVNSEFSREYGIDEGTCYLVSLTVAPVHGDKILVMSGGKTYIAIYEYTDNKKYIIECKENAKRKALKKSDIICGRIRGRLIFEY